MVSFANLVGANRTVRFKTFYEQLIWPRDIDAILHHEMTQRLGYDAKDHMMRVNYLAADGEPNWNANFASESPAPLPVLNAFIEALAHVKGQYDVSDEDQARLRRA